MHCQKWYIAWRFIVFALLHKCGASINCVPRPIDQQSKVSKPLCNISNIYSRNSWFCADEVAGDHVVLLGYEKCPRTQQSLTGTAKEHQHHYAAGNLTAQIYDPKDCEVLTFGASVDLLHKQGKVLHVHFIGDSVGTQQAVSMRCEIERLQLHDKIRVTYHTDVTLEPGVLCNDRCISDATFLAEQIVNFPQWCADCRTGIRMNASKYAADYWDKFVPAEANVLVLNTGAWYSAAWMEDGRYHYIDTLNKLSKSVLPFIQKGLPVVWMVLPVEAHAYAHEKTSYQRSEFTNRNDIACDILSAIGVLCLDFNIATKSRLNIDPSASLDGLHWRSPGEYSVTNFLSTTILHLIATNK